MGKSNPEMCATSVIFKPKVNNPTSGKNSPNLVTLLRSQAVFFRNENDKRFRMERRKERKEKDKAEPRKKSRNKTD
jgi:hypothetical protein